LIPLDALRGRHLFVAFFLIGLVPRLLVFNIALHRERPVYTWQDSPGYIMMADHLADGNGFRDEGGPLYHWPPGYPGFLALLFATGIASADQLAGALIAQVLLASLVVGMVSLLALRLGGRPAALLAGTLMALEPASIAHANMILTETLFTFLLLLAVLTWIGWWNSPKTLRLLTFAGLVGLLPLVRPVAIYLWVPIALLLLCVRPISVSRTRTLVAFITLATIPTVAWTLRNYVVIHVPIFAGVGQQNEARFARDVADLAGEPREASTLAQPWHADFGLDPEMSFPQVVKARHDYFVSVLMRHPVAAVERLALTAAQGLGVPDGRLPDMLLREVPSFQGGSVPDRLRWLWRLHWLGGLLLLGMAVSLGGVLALPPLVLRARAWPREKQALLGLLILLILYLLMMSSFVMYQSGRYRVPVIPLLTVTLSCALLRAPSGSGSAPSRCRGPSAERPSPTPGSP
jgi:4-amino-4-deoxy-L-arabinose transferase-like glycosyltransferase